MKLSAVLVALSISSSQSFSMISPRTNYFPQRFGKYLEEIDEMFEKDWPSTFMEKQLSEFKDTLSEQAGQALSTYKTSSPKYEIMDSSDFFEVKLEVPDFKQKEIEVGVRAGGRILTVTGKHEEKDEKHEFSSKFQQNFSLDPSIVVDKMTAEFVNGKIYVRAPRKVEKLPESRKIPIKMLNEDPGFESDKAIGEKSTKKQQKKGKEVKP
jgi:HSP20 family molecular chaperone IbpA